MSDSLWDRGDAFTLKNLFNKYRNIWLHINEMDMYLKEYFYEEDHKEFDKCCKSQHLNGLKDLKAKLQRQREYALRLIIAERNKEEKIQKARQAQELENKQISFLKKG